MKDLFTPVEFTIEPESEPKKKFPDPYEVVKEIDSFYTKVMKLVKEIESGRSDIRQPIQIKASPLFTVIDKMHYAPTKDNLNTFFEIALQDLGNRFKTECENYFNSGDYPLLNQIRKG